MAIRRHHRTSLPVTYVRPSFHSNSLRRDDYRDLGLAEDVSSNSELAADSRNNDTAIAMPELVIGFESYFIARETNASFSTKIDDHRIVCRNAVASIKTADGEHSLVKLASMGKKSLSFISEKRFIVGNRVSIATHYIEGAQNLYQDGRIARALGRSFDGSSGEYLVEFTRNA